LAVGIGAGWYLIPVTMRNTSDLIWEYEKKVPVVSETHAAIGGFARTAFREMRERGNVVAKKADEAAGEARKGVEGWVEKGR
jgi:MICOS complex subunit MIC26